MVQKLKTIISNALTVRAETTQSLLLAKPGRKSTVANELTDLQKTEILEFG